MKKLILIFLILFSTSTCLAGFGGGRSGGSSFSGGGRSSYSGGSFGGARSSGSSVRSFSSGSTFGGSRSSQSGPATITRPSAPSAPRYSAPVIQRETTVIHHDSGVGGFWSGMMMGNLLGHSQPVVVTPGVVGMQGGSVMEPVIVQQGHSIFFYLFWFGILGLVAWCVVRIVKGSEL